MAAPRPPPPLNVITRITPASLQAHLTNSKPVLILFRVVLFLFFSLCLQEGIIVGPPLRRPPPGWDDPAGVAQGRWAWGTEPPGEVQLNLAPRCVRMMITYVLIA